MPDFDSAWKDALDAYFEPFMAFFFAEAHREIDWTRGVEMLASDRHHDEPTEAAGGPCLERDSRV